MMNIARAVLGTAPALPTSRVVSICDTAEAAAFFARCFECYATRRDGLSLMLTGTAALGAWYLTLENEAKDDWDGKGCFAKVLAYRLRFETIQSPINFVCLGTQALSSNDARRIPDILRSHLFEALQRASVVYPQDVHVRPVLRSDELPDHYLHAPRGYLAPNAIDGKDSVNFLLNLSANTSEFSPGGHAFYRSHSFKDPHHRIARGRYENIDFNLATGCIIALDLLKNLHTRYKEAEERRAVLSPRVLESQREGNDHHQARLAIAIFELFILFALDENPRVSAEFGLKLETFGFMQGKLALQSAGAAAEWMVELSEAEIRVLASQATRWLYSEEQGRHLVTANYPGATHAKLIATTLEKEMAEYGQPLAKAYKPRNVNNLMCMLLQAIQRALNPMRQDLPTQDDVTELDRQRGSSLGEGSSRLSIGKRPR
ncbi:hypothetical protein JCM11641_002798 [Rhodosporidiobolus odoratus]